MGQNLKLAFNTPSLTNEGLKEALICIGKHYGKGKLANKSNHDNKYYLKRGVNYIAKKFGKFNIGNIRAMYKAKIKLRKVIINDELPTNEYMPMHIWTFNKRIYADAYYEIVQCLKKASKTDPYIDDILQKLFAETKKINPAVENRCSNALIYFQKEMLTINKISLQGGGTIAEKSIYILNKLNKTVDYVLPLSNNEA